MSDIKLGKKNLVHIHIGKCGGSSINMALHQLGIQFRELHCGNSPKELKEIVAKDDGSTIYLVSARDPITRVISAFNWDKYEKIVIQNTSNAKWQEIYKNFNSVEDLVSSLSSEDTYRRELAEYTFNSSNLHIHYGLSWYLPNSTLQLMKAKNIYLIRTENLLNDFSFFISNVFPNADEILSLPRDKDSSSFLDKLNISRPKYISEASKRKLKEVLKEDYLILKQLSSI